MTYELPGPFECRDLHTQQVTFLRGNMDHKRKKEPLLLGYVPAGAVITSMHAFVKTALANTKVKLGKTPDGQDFGELDVKDAGEKALNLANQLMIPSETVPTPIYATFTAEPNSGECIVVVQFVTNR